MADISVDYARLIELSDLLFLQRIRAKPSTYLPWVTTDVLSYGFMMLQHYYRWYLLCTISLLVLQQ